MSIIIKKKRQYNKKKLIQRIVILILIYFSSFAILYLFMHDDNPNKNTTEKAKIVYANEGEKALAEGDYATAIEYFLRKSDENPEDYISMTNLAIGYSKVNEIEKAKFYLYKSAELAPNYTLNYIQFANIYLMTKNYNAAENAINIIPLRTKQDFIDKANLLIQLANAEDNTEDKLIHYNKALNYLKKYDINEYNKQADIVIKILLQIADQNITNKDYQSAQIIYEKILKYKNNCSTRNTLAIRYMKLGKDELAIQNLTAAVQFAETQEEKRLTKENIIILRYYFEKKDDTKSLATVTELLKLLNENSILVDEKFTPVAIKDDKFEYITEKKVCYPKLNFSVFNKSEDNIPKLYAKMEIYVKSNKIISDEVIEVVGDKMPLGPSQETQLKTIEIHDTINCKKLDKYNVGLSLSTDAQNWKLYRLYKK